MDCLCDFSMPPKTVDSVLDYQFDWRQWLQADEDIEGIPVITANGLTINPSPNQTTVIDNVVTFWLADGVAGMTINVVCEIVTNQGRTMEAGFSLDIIP